MAKDKNVTNHIITRRMNAMNKNDEEMGGDGPFPHGSKIWHNVSHNLFSILSGELTESVEIPPKKKGAKPKSEQKDLFSMVSSGDDALIRSHQQLLDILLEMHVSGKAEIDLSAENFGLKEMAEEITKYAQQQAEAKKADKKRKAESFRKPEHYGAGIREFSLPHNIDPRGSWERGD